MDEASIEMMQLPTLLKHYASLSPSTPALLRSPPFPTPLQLCRPETQAWLVDNLLPSSSNELQDEKALDEEHEGGESWKKVFWRRVVKGVEEGFEVRKTRGESIEDEELHPEILKAFMSFLCAPSMDGAPCVDKRSYYWGDISQRANWKRVKMREERRMISGGTTGLRTWQASIALSNHLIADPSLLSHSTLPIVELGAGVGLLSLVAGQLSNRRIVATDFDANVLSQLDQNIQLNTTVSDVHSSGLDWELATSDEGVEELKAWSTATFGEDRPSLILGADIVYDPTLSASLAATLAFLLRTPTLPSLPKSQAYIAGTIRREATWEGFLQECILQGLSIESVPMLNTGENGIVGAEGWEGEGEVRMVRIVAN